MASWLNANSFRAASSTAFRLARANPYLRAELGLATKRACPAGTTVRSNVPPALRWRGRNSSSVAACVRRGKSPSSLASARLFPFCGFRARPSSGRSLRRPKSPAQPLSGMRPVRIAIPITRAFLPPVLTRGYFWKVRRCPAHRDVNPATAPAANMPRRVAGAAGLSSIPAATRRPVSRVTWRSMPSSTFRSITRCAKGR